MPKKDSVCKPRQDKRLLAVGWQSLGCFKSTWISWLMV